MRALKKILAFAGGACLIVFTLILSVDVVVFNKSFYKYVYEKIDLAETENISEEDLYNSIYMMIDYVHGDRDDLDGTITSWKGVEQPAFNEKEISHMVDVKALWLHARTVMIVCGIAAAGIYILLFFLSRKYWLAFIARGLEQAYACFAVILVFFGFWMAVDFSGLWVQFHHLFFSNNLWLLDPATDFMIVICPESLFFTMIVCIALLFGFFALLLLGFSIYYLKKKAVIGFDSLE